MNRQFFGYFLFLLQLFDEISAAEYSEDLHKTSLGPPKVGHELFLGSTFFVWYGVYEITRPTPLESSLVFTT